MSDNHNTSISEADKAPRSDVGTQLVLNTAANGTQSGWDPSAASTSSEVTPTKLDVGPSPDCGSQSNQNVKLDALGPMVVNSDGTLSRIANWDGLTDAEKERTLRVLNVRNKIRLAKQAMNENTSSDADVLSALRD